ncbi:MAG: alpha/beta hydrolase [Chlorobi bacterium]|nr:alpha/beta hydrolase [Chlorobiota bacterium]
MMASSADIEHIEPQLWSTITVARAEFRVLSLGADVGNANGALIALPNRWSDIARFLRLVTYVAPPSKEPALAVLGIEPPSWQHFWYPHGAYDTPLEEQNPYLDITLATIEQIIQRLTSHIPLKNISLFGIAEGASMILEYVARNTYPLNAAVALSGVLLGNSLDTSDRFNLVSSRTKVLLTASLVQPAGLRVRFNQTAQILKQNGYKVIALTYDRRPTTIVPEELEMSSSVIYGTFSES